MYVIGIGTIGVGIGLIGIATKYMMFFFPGKEGTFAAIGRGVGYCFMYGWYYLAEYIINPESIEQDKITKYYKDTVAENTKYYTLSIIFGTLISTVVFMVLTMGINFDEVKKKANEGKKEELVEQENQEKYEKDLKTAFISGKFWRLFVLCILLVFLPLLIASSNRVVGDKFGIKTEVIQLNVSIAGFLGAGTTPIIGYLYDRYGMRKIYFPLAIALAGTGAIFILAIYYHSNVLFAISLYLNNMGCCSYNAVIFPYIGKIFSTNYVHEIYGVIGFTIGLVGFAGTGLQYLLVDILQLKEMLPYFICYGLGMGFDILTLLIIFFENEEPLEYEEKKNTVENELYQEVTSSSDVN